ncbi:hypothetical protein [Megamonas sp.]|uniref:hypothetical protein n=1 Tax=Megamonas sp. TaxID=2049033 RepID=UPI002587AC87|nr:hypothetical protein [Megamonas sp.]
MKDIRLIIGIVTIILFVFVVLQSCGAHAIVQSSNGIGNIGIIISFIALIAALICINTRDAYSGAFISAVFYALAGFLGLFNFTNHKIVFVYGFMFIMFSIFSVLIGIKQKNASN